MPENAAEIVIDGAIPRVEKIQGEEIPRVIVQRIEEHLLTERHITDISKEPGGRTGACGFATSYVSEVVVPEFIAEKKCDLATCVVEAERLGHMVPRDLQGSSFLRHGFSIIVDRSSEEWWIIDTTLNQFTENTGDEGLKWHSPKIGVGENYKSMESEVARSLLKNGFVKMTRESLAAYIALMMRRPVDSKIISDYLSEPYPMFKLSDLVNNCSADSRWTVGNWAGATNVDRERALLGQKQTQRVH